MNLIKSCSSAFHTSNYNRTRDNHVTVDVQDYWIDELVDVVCVDKEPKVVLSCKYSNPNGNVHWFKNQMEIFHGHKYNCLNENGTFRLVINRICLQDSGLYICQTDDKTTSAELTVEGMKAFLTLI